MASSSFDYVLYVRASPDEVWEALTNAEKARRYRFDASQECSWLLDSPWEMKGPDGRLVNSGRVLKAVV